MSNFQLIIDNRENSLIELFENQLENQSIIKKNLDIGDIIIEFNNEPIIIIERKTLNDLSASIKDGRYKEQKVRFINTFKQCKKVYLIEKTGNFSLDNTIYTSVKINSIFRDDIYVYETLNLNDTYEFIMKCLKNIEKYKEKWVNGLTIDYIDNVNVNKKKNMDKKTIQILQLSVIPGISKITASKILEHFGSIKDFYIFYQENDETTFIKTLSSINTGKKKLGPKLSKKIYENI